ncbi:MAG: type I restriction enzyme HsdR N-terminal domain-containing protein [Thermonemataceae bacterium]|nr:type I restriction enzyme HsdR N-terminal domain-containing protein [Thermonemataceae bacterium]
MIYPLDIPHYEHQLKRIEGKLYIWDMVRKKYVFLSPEEWVRQQLLHYLVKEKKYPKSLIRIEKGQRYYGLSQRTDLVVYNNKAEVFMLVECKAPSVALKKEVWEQAWRYNTILRASHILISNGHSFSLSLLNQGSLVFLDQIPEMLNDILL